MENIDPLGVLTLSTATAAEAVRLGPEFVEVEVEVDMMLKSLCPSCKDSLASLRDCSPLAVSKGMPLLSPTSLQLHVFKSFTVMQDHR